MVSGATLCRSKIFADGAVHEGFKVSAMGGGRDVSRRVEHIKTECFAGIKAGI